MEQEVLNKHDLARLFQMARDGALSPQFTRWDLADQKGWTVAHEAARHGTIPEDFESHWRYMSAEGDSVAHIAARCGHLPESFSQWEITDCHGHSVAHEVLFNGDLPKSFDRWDLKSELSWSVAHAAAFFNRFVPDDPLIWSQRHHGGITVAHAAAVGRGIKQVGQYMSLRDDDGNTPAHLYVRRYPNKAPFDFSNEQLAMANKQGETVAHLIAHNSVLPLSFDGWHLKDARGWSVAHVAAYFGALPPGYDRWEITYDEVFSRGKNGEEITGVTVAHLAASKFGLPSNFNQWDLRDSAGATVAHYAAAVRPLPAAFDQWHLSDADGLTVAEVAQANGYLPEGFDWSRAQPPAAEVDGNSVSF